MQVKERLNALINLKIGLTEQCHSSGRPFTATEDLVIETELTNNNSKSDTLIQVAAQLRCSIGAVAVRSRQLRTLQILHAVSSRINTKQNALATQPQHLALPLTIPPLPLPLPLSLPAGRTCNNAIDSSLLGKRPCPATESDSSKKMTGTNADCDHSCNFLEEEPYKEEMSAHFSTADEASDC